MNSFRINRDLPEGRYKLREVFSGIEEIEQLVESIGDFGVLQKMVEETEVTLTDEGGYMYVDAEDGSLVVGSSYLKTADQSYLYLDVIHELVHVKQYLDGRELFEEGRRIGMTDDAIADYLYVEWITKEEYGRLLRTLGVTRTTRQARGKSS